MANGDAAAVAFGWTPVAPTEDIRLGYDRINQLADFLATQVGFTPWGLPLTLNATLFNTLTDPNGNSSGTLVGGVRKRGNMLDVSFRCKYIGATLTSTNGDIADTTIGTFNAGFRPSGVRLLQVGQSATATARLGADGALVLVTWATNSSLTSGTILQIEGAVSL